MAHHDVRQKQTMNNPKTKHHSTLQRLLVLLGLICTAASCVGMLIVGAKIALIFILLLGLISIIGTALRAAGDLSEIASETVELIIESISMVFDAISSLFN